MGELLIYLKRLDDWQTCSVDPDQMQRSYFAASDQGLHCLRLMRYETFFIYAAIFFYMSRFCLGSERHV